MQEARYGNEETGQEKGKKIKDELMNVLPLLATGIQPHWGPSEGLCLAILRMIPLRGEEATGIYPSAPSLSS